MTDLTNWLAEVHAADERTAREASGRAPDWHVEEGRAETWDSPHRDPAIIAGGKPILTEDVEYSRGFAVEHIARHDPQATLARIDAERLILADHADTSNGFVWGAGKWGTVCTRCCDQDRDGERSDANYPCATLRALAWGYRGRDGYRAEWAPEGVSADA